MKRITTSKTLLLAIVFACVLNAFSANAATMPQDTWAYYGKKLAVPESSPKKGITAGGNWIYVGLTVSGATTSIQKYTLAGDYVSTLATTFTDVTGMACDSAGKLYVFDRAAASLKSFDLDGNLLWSKGSAGNAQEQFSTAAFNNHATLMNQHSHLAIDGNNKLFVLDQGNARIQVFDNQGNFQTMWGSQGTNAGQFQGPFGVAAKNGQVVVVDSPGGNRQRIQSFTDSGVLVKSVGWPNDLSFIISNERFTYSPDGLLAAVGGLIGSSPGILFDQSLTPIGSLLRPGTGGNRHGGAFLPSGDFCAVAGPDVWIIERRHSSTDNPVVRNVLPQPEVIRSAQRPASTLVDIDYKVTDPDSATVDVAVLAFVNGGNSLADLLKLATFVEGTAANVGPGQASNQVKRLTWNAAVDWSTEFGEVEFEILAKDQRDLLGIHLITVPANGSTASFNASAKPVEDSDLLSIWFWLIAKSDPEIALVSGEVKGVGGAFDGQVLASGIVTSAQGRSFLYARLGIREITAQELTSLQSGNYGFSSSSTRTVVRQ